MNPTYRYPRGMVRYRPFGDTRLAELVEQDLQRLVDDGVLEGLFVEYKRDWAPEKVARAAASFANSESGGTIVVGIEADKLAPTNVVGVDVQGELAASAVQAIRSLVDPTPDFRPFEVALSNGRRCLVVEVPEGTEPPYVMVRSGLVLERTPTSSEPVSARNRETIDRLYHRGRRGIEWATKRGKELIEEGRQFGPFVSVWTVPAVENGLGVHGLIFKEFFLDELSREAPLPFEHSDFEVTPLMERDYVGVAKRLVYDTTTVVYSNGIVRTSWAHGKDSGGQRQDMTYNDIETLLRMCAARHPIIVERLLGHRGRATMVMSGSMYVPTRGAQLIDFQRDQVRLDAYPSVAEVAIRDVRRQMGSPVFEPE